MPESDGCTDHDTKRAIGLCVTLILLGPLMIILSIAAFALSLGLGLDEFYGADPSPRAPLWAREAVEYVAPLLFIGGIASSFLGLMGLVDTRGLRYRSRNGEGGRAVGGE